MPQRDSMENDNDKFYVVMCSVALAGLIGAFYYIKKSGETYEHVSSVEYEISKPGRSLKYLTDEDAFVLFEGSRQGRCVKEGTFFLDGPEQDGEVDLINHVKYAFPAMISPSNQPAQTVNITYKRLEDFDKHKEDFLEADKKLASSKEYFRERAKYFPEDVKK